MPYPAKQRKTSPATLFMVPVLFLLIVLLCTGISRAVQKPFDLFSPEEQRYLQSHGQIVFVSQTSYPPFESLQKDGAMDGMCIELARWMSTEFGFQTKFLNMTFEDAQQAVLSGRADVLTSLFYSDKRSASFAFSEPLFDVPASIFVKAERPDIRRLEDLNGKRIAIQRGDYAKEFLVSKGIVFDLVPTDNFAQATSAVIEGKADALIGDEQIVLYYLFSNRLTKQAKKVGEPLYIGKNCMATQKGNLLLNSILEKSLRHAREAGVFDSINRKWIGVGLAPGPGLLARLAPVIAFSCAGMLLIILVGFGVNRRLRKLVQVKTLELRTSEEYYRSLIDNAADAIFVHSTLDGRILDCNRQACTSLGYSRQEILALSVRDIEAGFSIDRDVKAWENLKNGATATVEGVHRRKDGSEFPVEVKIVQISDPESQRAVAAARDVTDRKLIENKIKRSEEMVRTILDTVDECFFVVDRDLAVLTANKAFCELVGKSGEEILGRTCNDISSSLTSPCSGDSLNCAVEKVFDTGRSSSMQHRYLNGAGQEVIQEMKAYPILDSDGQVVKVIQTVSDITEKHLLEEERLKTQKLESIGTLAGGIAHDFNNLLQGVFGYISLATIRYGEKEACLSMLQEAEKALQQSVNLTGQLLTFAKGGKPVKKLMHLMPALENAVKFALSGSHTDYRLEVVEDPWPVDADEGQLVQVIQNIVLNARQAMADQGEVSVRVENAVIASGALAGPTEGGRFVRLLIGDAGPGIPEQHLPRIFDPYFTTKQKGSGLGLATAYSIIRNHGGDLQVDSEPGRGAVFSIYLPAVCGEVGGQETSGPGPARGKTGRVLFMDDEEMMRKVAGEMLTALGHDVVCASSGQAAVDLFCTAREQGRPYDVVILDLTVKGGMGGEEACRLLRETDPDAITVVSSGYADKAVLANYREYGFAATLNKPYKIEQLRACLDSLL